MLELDTSALEAVLEASLDVIDDTAGLAHEAELEALGHAVLGLRRNVYDTTPGAYERTQDLLRGMLASSSGTRVTATVLLRNVEPYAVFVELGSEGFTLAQDQTAAAANRTPAQPVSFGRSGQRYTIAGPFMAPAQFYALWRMADLLGVRLRSVQRST